MLEFEPRSQQTFLTGHFAAFRGLLVVGLHAGLDVKLLFDMNKHIKFPGVIRGGLECYADAMLPKLSYAR